MKAITVCQPFAHLIVTPQPELDGPRKRVENRTWETSYRGPLAIHAGKSMKWLNHDDGPRFKQSDFSEMAFGAIVGIVELIECVWVQTWRGRLIVPHPLLKTYGWIERHFYASGPCCWVLNNAQCITPIPYRGRQRLFDVPDELFTNCSRR